MTAHPIPFPVADRLGKLIARLASPHEGEVIATVCAIDRTLRTAGLDLNDLAETVKKGTPVVGGAAAPSTAHWMRPDFSYRPAPWTSRPGPTAAMRTRSIVIQCQARRQALTHWESEFLTSLRVRLDGGQAATPAQTGKLSQIARKLGVGASL